MMNFLKALSVFIGTVIGVGIFGLPFIAYKAGFLVVLFYFLLMVGIVILVHLLFGEICLGTKEAHRFPGYAEIYLGSVWKKVVLVTGLIGIFGALLAYLIVGGEFLRVFFSPWLGGDFLIYALAFFACGSYLIFKGIKSVSQIELILLFVLLAILVLFFFRAIPFINFDYFKEVNLQFVTFPYGVILFSLWGLSIVPELEEMLKSDREKMKKVITWGILISAVVYLIFIFIIFGASGPNTSKTGIDGFIGVVGDGILLFGFLFGVITCFTSFLSLGLTLKKTLWLDFGVPKNLSWFITCFFPLLFLFLGFREFIDIIGLIGALTISVEGVIMVFLYREFFERKFSRRMNPLLYLLIPFFVLGIGFEIFYFFFIR